MCKVSGLLQEICGFDTVESAFFSLASPDTSGGLGRARGLGAARVAMVPHSPFDGALRQRVEAQAHERAEIAAGLQHRLASHLGDCGAPVDLGVERYHETSHDVRTNATPALTGCCCRESRTHWAQR